MSSGLPALITKALADTGYDLVTPADEGWFIARTSGAQARVWVQPTPAGVLLALPEAGMASRIGLAAVNHPPPEGTVSLGMASEAAHLYAALRVLHSLQTHPAGLLAARLEERLAAVPETERTREVRQRIGQDVFREALMDLWQRRCAVTGLLLPPALLRASHAKPWAKATDAERLDPFNGLLLATHLDAMFDAGLITFADDGRLICSPKLDPATRLHFRISDDLLLRTIAPGHSPYLSWHRQFVYLNQ